MRNLKVLFIGLVLVALGTTTYAQAPYKHSIGGVIGTFYGVSYKTFAFSEKLPLQVDLGTKMSFWGGLRWGLDVNPNLMYQQPISNIGLHWFAGGGVSLGYAFRRGGHYLLDYDYNYRGYYGYGYGRFGVNAIGGVEYKFKFPLTVQADFRPGFGLLFRKNDTNPYFDWGVAVSARYAF